jgi:DNA-binding LacI/PurR family transcriptional regulator
VADLHNPLFAEIADQVRVRLEREGRHYFITSAMIKNEDGMPFLDKQTLKSIIDLRPESLLVIGSIPKIEILEGLPKDLPIIIASGVPIGIPRAATVRTNDEIGMRLVIDHLVEKGHKNIAYISGASSVVSKDRQAGYEKAMADCGLAKYINVIKAPTDDETAGYEATKSLLSSKNAPTAIACFNDLQAIGAQAAIQDLGAQVSLVGYDNTYLSSLSQISLTSVDPGNREIADKCADFLLEDDVNLKLTHFSTPTLVARSSSAKGVK